MLGERSMWFKKHFFEKSLRFPLIIAGPGIAPQRDQVLTSLVDIVPNLNTIAGVENALEPLEGVDLLSLADRGNPPSERAVYAEYLAEAIKVPMFMIRRGKYKFISSSHDGIMLFDLSDDPNERTYLAHTESHRELIHGFIQEGRR